jgi:hypothetical protein
MPKLNPRRGSSCAGLIGHLLSGAAADDLSDDAVDCAKTLSELNSKKQKTVNRLPNLRFDNDLIRNNLPMVILLCP